MSIQTNLGANVALLNTNASGVQYNKEIARLSSGFRINSSGDDAAGLAIANKLRGQDMSLQAASRNASQANSMLQIADGATNTISTILDRMKTLATQANSATIGTQTDKLNAEFASLVSEIDRIAQTTTYQGSSLINGSFGDTVDVAGSTAIGAGKAAGAQINGTAAGTYNLTYAAGKLTMTNSTNTLSQTISDAGGAQTLNFSAFGISLNTLSGYVAGALGATAVHVTAGPGGGAQFMVSSSGDYGNNDLISLSSIDLTTTTLGVHGLTLTDPASAQTALTAIDAATDKVNTAIGSIGAAESRIGYAQTNVDTIDQNTSAAESTIRDANMAQETTAFTKFNILQQAGMAMISQANSSASQVLTLLR